MLNREWLHHKIGIHVIIEQMTKQKVMIEIDGYKIRYIDLLIELKNHPNFVK